FTAQRAIPARLEPSEVLLFLQVNVVEPLHVADTVIAWDDEAKRRTLMLGERLAVERIGEEQFRSERLVARQAPSEVLLERELLCAPLDIFLPVIGAKKHELARRRVHAGGVEHRLQRQAGPFRVAGQPTERPAIAGTFEAGDQFLAAH